MPDIVLGRTRSQRSDRSMRLVLDTNVLVSALLNPARAPDRALAAVCARKDVVLFDPRIVAEYRAVLARPKFPTFTVERTEAAA